jgi:hypothetical protein
MSLVHARIFLAVGAWLLGTAAATGGSLVAVSLLGHSLEAPPTQQLTVGAVNRALASDGKEPSATPPASPAQRPGAGLPTPAASPSATPGSAIGKLLISAGGSVLASCGPSGAYLISWSPQQGYQADEVVRGPASQASVAFLTGQTGVRMTVSCTGTVPSASISAVHSDDSGWGDDS